MLLLLRNLLQKINQ